MDLDSKYWENRYREKTTGWDLGTISPPIKKYIDQLNNKDLKILIPGAGNAYEAEYLFNQGFKNIYVADIACSPLKNIKSRVCKFPTSQLLHIDFFDIDETFDLIIEQTFFCAIDPSLRNQYVIHANRLLNKGGKIVGLLFDEPLYEDHPPFGGSKKEYENRFSTHFVINSMEISTNSVDSRKGKELFIDLTVIKTALREKNCPKHTTMLKLVEERIHKRYTSK